MACFTAVLALQELDKEQEGAGRRWSWGIRSLVLQELERAEWRSLWCTGSLAERGMQDRPGSRGAEM